MFPDNFCKEAMEQHDDMRCVPRQIVAVLKRETTDLCVRILALSREHCINEMNGWTGAVHLQWCLSIADCTT